MGNVIQKDLLEDQPDWPSYVEAPWRSERAKELDRLGGLSRRPVARGDSFSAKLQLLQSGCAENAQALETILAKKDEKARPPADRSRRALAMQASQRRDGQPSPPPYGAVPPATPPNGAPAPPNAMAPIKRSPSVNRAMDQQPRASSSGERAPPRKWSSGGRSAQVQVPAAAAAAIQQDEHIIIAGVAEWRVRMHRARKRVLLIVWTCIRFRRGVKVPQRMRRCDSFSFAIPLVLASSYVKFVEEQGANTALRTELEHIRSQQEEQGGAVMAAAAAGAAALALAAAHEAPSAEVLVKLGPAARSLLTSRPASVGESGTAGLHGTLASRPPSAGRKQQLAPLNVGGADPSGAGYHQTSTFTATQSHLAPSQLSRQDQHAALKGVGKGERESLESPTSTLYFAPTSPDLSDPDEAGAGRQRPGTAGGVVLPPIVEPISKSVEELGFVSKHLSLYRSAETLRSAGGRRGRASDLGGALGSSSYPPLMPSTPEVEEAGGLVGRADSLLMGARPLSRLQARSTSDLHSQDVPSTNSSGGGSDEQPVAIVHKMGSSGSFRRRTTTTSSPGFTYPGSQGNVSAGMPHPHPPTAPGQLDDSAIPPPSRAGGPRQFTRVGMRLQVSWPKPPPPPAPEPAPELPRPLSRSVSEHQQSLATSLAQLAATTDPTLRQQLLEKLTAVAGGISVHPLRHSAPSILDVVPAPTGLVNHALTGIGIGTVGAARAVGEAVEAQQALAIQQSALALALQERDTYKKIGKSDALLGMFANRCNAKFAENQLWGPPRVWEKAEQDRWSALGEARAYRSQAQELLSRGCIAFHFLCESDSLAVQGGEAGEVQDMWGVDPWDLMHKCRPGLLAVARHPRSSYTLQGRVLTQLVLQVREACGSEAVSKLHVLINMNDEQQEEVTRDLWDHKFYGLEREHVIMMVQSKRHGYRYDDTHKRFAPASGTPREALGSGFSLMQLNWVPDAFILNEDGLQQSIMGSALEQLARRGVSHMLTHRSRDTGLLTRDGVLDLGLLGGALYMRERFQANIVLGVALTDNIHNVKSMDSVVLARENFVRSGHLPPQSVIELCGAEVASPKMQELMQGVRQHAMAGGRLAVGLQRYVTHLPSLSQLLVSQRSFRPKLRVTGDVVRMALAAADITSCDGALAVAMEARHTATAHVAGPSDLEAFLSVVQQQELDIRLMEALAASRPAGMAGLRVEAALALAGGAAGSPGAAMALGQRSAGSGGRVSAVFLDRSVASVAAARMALALARPGKDVVALATFVANEHNRPEGEAVLGRTLKQLAAMAPCVEIVTEVVVKGVYGMLEIMQLYLSSAHVDLLLLGSDKLAQTSLSYIIGSITLACLKRLECPTLIVTPRAWANIETLLEKKRLHLMALADGHSHSMMPYLMDRLADNRRQDKVVLAQVHHTRLTRQQAINQRRVMAAFEEVSNGARIPSVQVVLGGALDEVLPPCIDEHAVNMVALQLPPGQKSVPNDVLALIRQSKAAVLLYKPLPVPAKKTVFGRPVDEEAGEEGGEEEEEEEPEVTELVEF